LLMLAYELYTFNKKEGYEFIGLLPERRKNPTRMTEDSVMSWGKTLFADNVDSKNMFFKRVILDNNGRILWVNLYINSHTIIFQ
jgi:hypothetical protein